MTRRIATYLAVAAATALLAIGCAKPVESVVCHVNPNKWSAAAIVEYNNLDTLSMRDISFFARCNTSFERSELPVTIRIEAPDSTYCVEEVVWRFDSERAPMPTVATKQVGYRKDCQLKQQGRYTFAITPSEPAEGIEAVGLIIDKQKR